MELGSNSAQSGAATGSGTSQHSVFVFAVTEYAKFAVTGLISLTLLLLFPKKTRKKKKLSLVTLKAFNSTQKPAPVV